MPQSKSLKKNILKKADTTKGKKNSSGKKKPVKKASGSKKQKNSFLHDERYHLIGGIFLLILSLYLLVSLGSYIYNYTGTGTNLSNAGGYFGRSLGNLLMHTTFGSGALVIPVWAFIAGVLIIWPGKISRPTTIIFHTLFWIIWLPSLMAFIFYTEPFVMFAGSLGTMIRDLLISGVGKVFSIIIVAFLLITYLIFGFNFHLLFRKKENPQKKKSKKTNTNNIPEEGVDIFNTNEYAVDDSELETDFINSTTVGPDKENKNNETTATAETPVDTKNIELEAPAKEDQKKDKPEAKDDINLTVEEVKEEEKVTTPRVQEHYGLDTKYDPRLDLPDFIFPETEFLKAYGSDTVSINKQELEENKNKIVKTLNNYSIKIDQIKATIGPTITLYEIVPAPGIRISKIKNLEDDIALSLSALGIRIIAPIPGKGTIGIEVPNRKPQTVSMKSIIESTRFQDNKFELPIGLGKTIANESFVADLTKMPHLLIAGATGQGKSVGLNAILTSLLYKKHPSELKLILVDPKKVELTLFNRIERHYLAKLPNSEEAIITDTKKVVQTLNSLIIEMENRYNLLKDAQVRNIKEYNARFIQRKLNPEEGHSYLPYIVLVVDEFADLIMTAGKEIEQPITRLAQLARAIGIHLIIATQRPSVNIITGTIKANFPARIAFRVVSKMDSRTILDSGGADQLVGRGDMLLSTGSDITRLQCAFVDTPEVETITDFIGSQRGYPEAFALPEVPDEEADEIPEFSSEDRDPLFEDAARMIVINQHGSTSLLQRKLKLGYNRAGRLIDQLEAVGIVGPFEGSKAREVKIGSEMALEQFLKDLYAKENSNKDSNSDYMF